MHWEYNLNIQNIAKPSNIKFFSLCISSCFLFFLSAHTHTHTHKGIICLVYIVWTTNVLFCLRDSHISGATVWPTTNIGINTHTHTYTYLSSCSLLLSVSQSHITYSPPPSVFIVFYQSHSHFKHTQGKRKVSDGGCFHCIHERLVFMQVINTWFYDKWYMPQFSRSLTAVNIDMYIY